MMEAPTTFHRIRECPDCKTYWRETGRHTVGFVDFHDSDTCPSCAS